MSGRLSEACIQLTALLDLLHSPTVIKSLTEIGARTVQPGSGRRTDSDGCGMSKIEILLISAVLLCYTLQGRTSNNLHLRQHSISTPFKFAKSVGHVHHVLRLSGGAVTVPTDDDGGLSDEDSSDDDDEEEDDESNDDWLKYVPENPEDDPEFMASFEQLQQAIIDAGDSSIPV